MVGMQPAPQLREATLTQLLWETCKAIFDRGSEAISVTMGQICTQTAGGNTTCKGNLRALNKPLIFLPSVPDCEAFTTVTTVQE